MYIFFESLDNLFRSIKDKDIKDRLANVKKSKKKPTKKIHLPKIHFKWSSGENKATVQRQISVSSDSKLLDADIAEETRVLLRNRKPPRPKSEVFLNKYATPPSQSSTNRRTKRFSAFGAN
ncbi:hypothetical protein M8J75_012180 [Diaphorina citri]|nr:hypothetical protein M8J75_012180 [Diaphorina citri]